MSDTKPRHHYLASTQVIYIEKGIRNQMGVNALLVLDDKNVTQHAIGHIQQIAQITFYRISGKQHSPDLNIVDVFIQGISYLGHMTEADFMIRPELREENARDAINAAIGSDASEKAPDPFAPDKSVDVAPTTEAAPEEPPQATPEPVVVQDEPVDQVQEQVDIADGTSELKDLQLPKN